jgi:transposase-like protein
MEGERGRPSKYTQEIADYICSKISEGITLSEICREEGMPSRGTVYNWLNDAENQSFIEHFARARDLGFDAIAEECLEIADDTTQDTVQTVYGPKPDTEWIQRSKLRVETRLKLLAKWSPKKYVESVNLNHGGTIQNNNVTLTPEEAKAIAKGIDESC